MTLEIEIVTNHLRDVEMNRLPQIARKTGRPVEQINAAIDSLSRLNPFPGHLVGSRPCPSSAPTPSSRSTTTGRSTSPCPTATARGCGSPNSYRRLAKSRRTERDARQFIQRNIRSAQWLISAIQQRRDTVRRVVEEVFLVQRDFLEHGKEALKPLPDGGRGQQGGRSRGHHQPGRGGQVRPDPARIFPLRMFFAGGTVNKTDGHDVSWDAVKAKLLEVVAARTSPTPQRRRAGRGTHSAASPSPAARSPSTAACWISPPPGSESSSEGRAGEGEGREENIEY